MRVQLSSIAPNFTEGTAKWLASGFEIRGIGDPGGGSIPLPSSIWRLYEKMDFRCFSIIFMGM